MDKSTKKLGRISGHLIRDPDEEGNSHGKNTTRKEIYTGVVFPRRSIRQPGVLFNIGEVFKKWFGWEYLDDGKIKIILDTIQGFKEPLVFQLVSEGEAKLLDLQKNEVLHNTAKKVIEKCKIPVS